MRPAQIVLACLLLSVPAWATRELEIDSYLDDAEYGVMATSAAGGPKGWVGLRAMAWYPALRGSGNDDGGGDFDMRDDLGLDSNEIVIVPQLTANLWIFGFRADYFNFQSSGESTLTQTFTFGGVTFPAGEDVVSDVELTSFRSLGFIRFLDTEVVRIAGLIGFNLYEYEATITSATLGTAQLDGTLPFPVIGLLVQVRTGDFLFEFEGSGFFVDYSDVSATALDFSLSAAWNFLKMGEVRAGYRWVSIDGTFEDTRLDLRLDGFFLSLGVNF
ncbi:MAG: porin family protein [Planctomycetota bacterium]|jgi:hypothetical protein